MFICSLVARNTTSVLGRKNTNADFISLQPPNQIISKSVGVVFLGEVLRARRRMLGGFPGWVPSKHVLISLNRSTFTFVFAFRTHFYRKGVWGEAESLSLCFEHCYSRKQHISQALFRPSQALIEVTTGEAHSEQSKSGFYVTNYTRPIPFRQVLWLGHGFSNLDFPPL